MSTLPAAPVIPDLGFLIREPAEEYHAKAKEYLSSHQLGDFRKCPCCIGRKSWGWCPTRSTSLPDWPGAAHPRVGGTGSL